MWHISLRISLFMVGGRMRGEVREVEALQEAVNIFLSVLYIIATI